MFLIETEDKNPSKNETLIESFQMIKLKKIKSFS